MIPFPTWLSPEIFSIDLFGMTFALRWYALAYIVGLLIGWRLVLMAIRTPRLWSGAPPLNAEQVERLLTWVIVGVILGGRAGYVLFYDLPGFMADPAAIIRIWEGGMSFHGGLLGVTLAGVLFAWKEKAPALSVGDLFAIAVTPGLLLGRLSNFVNAELWGRPTDLPWGVIFPGDAAQACEGVVTLCARHPSQLYEAAMEGLILGAVILWLVWGRKWTRAPGRVMGVFIAGYGTARFIVEFFRQPDPQFIGPGNPLGLAWQIGGWGLTQGQALSLPMVLVGLWFIFRARQPSRTATA